MNAKQRNQNRDTAQNLKLANGKWNSRNRRIEKPLPFVMVCTDHYMPRLIAVLVQKAA